MDKENPPIVDSNEATAVHLSYIRRDIVDIKSQLIDLKNSYVTQVDFDKHLNVDKDHEDRIRALEKDMWKRIGLTSAISALGSSGLLTVIQHFIK